MKSSIIRARDSVMKETKTVMDDDSLGGESWMDQSIQIYIDTRQSPEESDHASSGNENNDADIAIAPPFPQLSYGSTPYKNVLEDLLMKPGATPLVEPSAPSLPPPSNPKAKSISSSPDSTAIHIQKRESSQKYNNQNLNTIPSRSLAYEKKHGIDSHNKSVSRFIVSRTSLPYKIEYSENTMEWTLTLHTNQDALDKNDQRKMEESIMKSSFLTEQEARAACEQYAPPRMHSFEDYAYCHICKKSFNKVIRRPCHCYNCGVCVCTKCTETWPSVMLPITFTMTKKRRQYRVCLACDWISNTFRLALLSGDIDKIDQLHSTGNLNLRVPFAKARGSYYPVHCAILSGSLTTLKWLVQNHYCPIHSTNKRIPCTLDYHAVLTTEKKSVLSLAMENQELSILYYLIIELGINIMQYDNLTVSLKTIQLLLRHLPDHLKCDQH